MKVLLSLLPILFIGSLFYLFVISIRDAFKLKGTEQVAWVCLIIFLFPLGSIIYIVARPNKQKSLINKHRDLLIASIIVASILLSIGIVNSFKPTPHLKIVTLAEVITQANNGQIKRIEIRGDELIITRRGEEQPTEKSRKQPGSSLREQGLNLDKVEIIASPE